MSGKSRLFVVFIVQNLSRIRIIEEERLKVEYNRIRVNKKRREICIYGYIDEELEQEIFIALRELAQPQKLITVYLSSGGGSVQSAFLIYDKFKKQNIKIIVETICYSASLIILASASKRECYSHSSFMFHSASYPILFGNTETKLKKDKQEIEKINKEFCLVLSKIGFKKEEMQYHLDKDEDFFFDANYAKKHKIINKIL